MAKSFNTPMGNLNRGTRPQHEESPPVGNQKKTWWKTLGWQGWLVIALLLAAIIMAVLLYRGKQAAVAAPSARIPEEVARLESKLNVIEGERSQLEQEVKELRKQGIDSRESDRKELQRLRVQLETMTPISPEVAAGLKDEFKWARNIALKKLKYTGDLDSYSGLPDIDPASVKEALKDRLEKGAAMPTDDQISNYCARFGRLATIRGFYYGKP